MKPDGYKECPACAEYIRENAKVCRFCGAILTNEPLPQFVARGFQQEENELDASVQERFGHLGVELSQTQKRRIVEFLKSSDDQYRAGTVLFSDVTSYTKLCQELRAEEVLEIVRAYYSIFSSTVDLYNGFVVEFAGDGALAVFGAPMAFDRDVEAGVRAALDIRERVRALPEFSGRKIRISAGLATGEILSAIVRERFPPHYKIIGPAVNLAARVQSSAETDTVVIDDETYAQVKGVFECVERPPREFKNVNRAVATYVVEGLRAGGIERRRNDTPLVGRRVELAALEAAWRNRDTTGPVIVVRGEAGIGKSRLMGEFAAAIATEANVQRRECSPFEQRVPYALWRGVLQTLLDGDARAAGATLDARLDAWLAALGFGTDERDPLRLVFGIQSAVDGPLSALAPRLVFRLVCADVGRALSTVAAGCPMVLALDDLQWGDRSSLDVLTALAVAEKPPGVFFVAAHRADFAMPGDGWANVPTLALAPLGEDERRQLFDLLADTRALLPEMRERLLQQAEGNPLYLIEFFASLGKLAGAAAPGENWVPPSLRQMIQARIDALDERRKAVLQACSVIGRRFALTLVQVFDQIREDLLSRLYSLKSAEYLQDDPRADELVFYFQQNLTREVSYGSLLDRRRREFHLMLAEYLEERLEEGADVDLALIAYHYQSAQSDLKAAHFLEKAGDRARKVGASSEARESFETALACLARRKPTNDTQARRVRLYNALGTLDRYAGELVRAEERLGEALRAANSLGLPLAVADIRHRLAFVMLNAGKPREARDQLLKVLVDAKRLKDGVLEAKVLNILGVASWNLGEHKAARRYYERCLARSHRNPMPDQIADLYSNLGLIAWKQGKLAEGTRLLTRSVAMRRKSGNRFGMAAALLNLGIIREQQGKAASARRAFTRAQDMARAIGYRQVETASLINLSNLALAHDSHADAVVLASKAVDLSRQTRDPRNEAIARENLALALVGLRRFDDARRELVEAMTIGEQLGDNERLLSLRLVALEAELREGRVVPDIAAFQRAAAELEERGIRAELPRAHRLWGEALRAAGDETTAMVRLQAASREARKQSLRIELTRLEGLLKNPKPLARKSAAKPGARPRGKA